MTPSLILDVPREAWLFLLAGFLLWAYAVCAKRHRRLPELPLGLFIVYGFVRFAAAAIGGYPHPLDSFRHRVS